MTRRLAALAFCCVLAAACGGGGRTPEPPGPTDRPGTDDSRPSGPQAALLSGVQASLFTYWSSKVRGFEAPTWSFYTEANPPTGAACTPESWRSNSFYCPSDGHIYLDLDYAAVLAERFGDGGAVWLAAHEYGHRVHDEVASIPVLPVGEELGADCAAGVFVAALSSGGYTVSLEEGDVAKMLETVRANADKDWTADSWNKPSVHGGPPERASAFATGYITGDNGFCAPYATMTHGITTLPLGQYEFRPPPAMDYRPSVDKTAFSLSNPSSDLRLDVSTVGKHVPPTAIGMLNDIDWYFSASGSTVKYVDAADSFEPIGSLLTASRRYVQTQADGKVIHGALVAVTPGDGTALLLDAYLPGPAPATDADWESLGDFVFSALFGITS